MRVVSRWRRTYHSVLADTEDIMMDHSAEGLSKVQIVEDDQSNVDVGAGAFVYAFQAEVSKGSGALSGSG